MEYGKFNTSKYLGEGYQEPLLDEAEVEKLKKDLESRATFTSFSEEYRGRATPKEFT